MRIGMARRHAGCRWAVLIASSTSPYIEFFGDWSGRGRSETGYPLSSRSRYWWRLVGQREGRDRIVGSDAGERAVGVVRESRPRFRRGLDRRAAVGVGAGDARRFADR